MSGETFRWSKSGPLKKTPRYLEQQQLPFRHAISVSD
jgi:hypothetical protein